MRMKQHLQHNDLWMWRIEPPLTSWYDDSSIHRWWWQRHWARLIAIGSGVGAPSEGHSDLWQCGPIVLTGLASTHSALNTQTLAHSSDFTSPSTQPEIFCLISEFYTTLVAKYGYKILNSRPCTNIVSSLITNTCNTHQTGAGKIRKRGSSDSTLHFIDNVLIALPWHLAAKSSSIVESENISPYN